MNKHVNKKIMKIDSSYIYQIYMVMYHCDSYTLLFGKKK